MAEAKRVNSRGMWGYVGLPEQAVVSDVLGAAARTFTLHQTAFDNASAIRVCQPGPVAFQRANVSGGNRREIDVRALPDFGRPRGFDILAAVPAPKICGNTSCALRARAKVSFVHTGFSRSAFWGLGLRFISFDLAFVGLAQTNHMRFVGTRREYHQYVIDFRSDPMSEIAVRRNPFEDLRLRARCPTRTRLPTNEIPARADSSRSYPSRS
jgi:hypothetical protein